MSFEGNNVQHGELSGIGPSGGSADGADGVAADDADADADLDCLDSRSLSLHSSLSSSTFAVIIPTEHIGEILNINN